MEQNKINGQVYRQVFVKNEADLPKEEGTYLAFRRNLNEITNIHIFPDNKESRKRWMDEIDWYLLPVDQVESNEARKVALEIICNREHLVNFPFDYKKGLANEIADAITKEAYQPEPPVYDEQYLNDCIKKATPGLSKIKDVDKTLDEIRGIEPLPEQSKHECYACHESFTTDGEKLYHCLHVHGMGDTEQSTQTAENDFRTFLISKNVFAWYEIDMIEKYFNEYTQSQPKEITVTDEEIDTEFPIKSETTALTFGYIQANTNKRIGAKWFRDQLKRNNGLK